MSQSNLGDFVFRLVCKQNLQSCVELGIGSTTFGVAVWQTVSDSALQAYAFIQLIPDSQHALHISLCPTTLQHCPLPQRLSFFQSPGIDTLFPSLVIVPLMRRKGRKAAWQELDVLSLAWTKHGGTLRVGRYVLTHPAGHTEENMKLDLSLLEVSFI